MLKRTASRWLPAQYPASYSCEDAGYGYPANSQEVVDFVPVFIV